MISASRHIMWLLVTISVFTARINDHTAYAQQTTSMPAGDICCRAAMLVAPVAEANRPVISLGSVVWSTIPAPPGQPGGLALKAEVDIPDLKMHASMVLRRNFDAGLPASHTIDLRLTFESGSSIKGVKDIALPLMRRDDPPAADALLGVRVKINDHYFLIGLNRDEADSHRNVQELAERTWFDFPMQLDDKRIAKLTFEKGTPGQQKMLSVLGVTDVFKGNIPTKPGEKSATAYGEILGKSLFVASSSFETSGNSRWIVFASSKNVDEAIGLARRFGQDFGKQQVFSTSNSWYAVVAGPVANIDAKLLKKKLSTSGWVPKGTFLSKGQTFVERVWQTPKSPVLATASTEQGEPRVASAGGLEARIVVDGAKTFVEAKAGGQLTTIPVGDGVTPNDSTHLALVMLDPASRYPQVVTSYFTGGAHCCTAMNIAAYSESRWRIIEVGEFDLDGPTIEDLNGDGNAELVGKDDSFDYAFNAYALSYAPPKIFKFDSSKVIDASRSPDFHRALRQMLLGLEGTATPEQWKSNGFLGGWVAHKSLIGEGAEAWRKMLEKYDRNSDWDLSICAVETKLGEQCPPTSVRKRDFPTALREHLASAGYDIESTVDGQIATTPPAPSASPSIAKSDDVPPSSEVRQAKSSGTGFFVSGDGDVITNAHVVEGCSTISIRTSGGENATAYVRARDERNDLTLLRTGVAAKKVAAFRTSIRLGEGVEAFGYPLTFVLSTSGNFTLGNVSALAGIGDDTRYLQMSAPVQPGNSGGGLLDQAGNVVGVVSAKVNALKIMVATNGDIPQNVNFAIKASIVENFLDANSIAYAAGSVTQAMQPADIADLARAMSVFISCN